MRKKLKAIPLTVESFSQFGKVISSKNSQAIAGDENFSWWEKLGAIEGLNQVSVNILEAKKREMKVEKLEYHKETPEVIVPLGGKEVVIVVAPAGELDEEEIKAFRLSSEEGVVLNTGVRHFIPYPIGESTDCVIIFKDATGANDLIFEDLSQAVDIVL